MSGIRGFFARQCPPDVPDTPGSPVPQKASLKVTTVARICAGIAVTAALLAGVDLAQNLAGAREGTILDSPGGAGWRSRSKNNMKQIGLALHNYHEVEGQFPPGATVTVQGEPRHSWVTMILPHLDQAPLHKKIHFDKAWDDPANLPATCNVLPSLPHPGFEQDRRYRYQARVTDKPAVTHYAANMHVFGPNLSLRFRDLKDGSSNVFMAGEVASNFVPWGKPGNWRDPRLGINKSPVGFGSPSPSGAHFLLGDGTVRFISQTVDPEILRQLGTPADGATAGEF